MSQTSPAERQEPLALPAPPRRRRVVPAGAALAAVAALAALLLAGCGLRPSVGAPPPPPVPEMGALRQVEAQRYFEIDSNNVVVLARERRWIAPLFLRVDAMQRAHRRLLGAVPARAAVVVLAEPDDSARFAPVLRALGVSQVTWARLTPPPAGSRPGEGPSMRAGPIMLDVVDRWLRAGAGDRDLPDWIDAGLAQLVTDIPSPELRDAVLSAQFAELVSLDSLQRLTIPRSTLTDSLVALATPRRPGERPQAARPTGPGGRPVPPRAAPVTLAALQAASVLELLWAREGRWAIPAILQAAREGRSLADVLRRAEEVPNDLGAFEVVWRGTLVP